MPTGWLRIVVLTVPMIAMSLGCASGQLVSMTTAPLAVDRKMAIGETFERQGRFAEAQTVYRDILEDDPVSPAAERLLAVIAAADVTNAQNLPVEKLMSVGEFYERHGNTPLAAGVYRHILNRQSDFEPARERLKAIAAHDQQLIGRSAAKPIERKGSGREIGPLATAALRGSRLKENSFTPTPIDASQSGGIKVTSYAEPTSAPGDALTPMNASGREEHSATQVSNSATSAAWDPSGLPLPPGSLALAPSATMLDKSAPSKGKATKESSKPEASERAFALWQDKPINDLKASIALTFPESQPLRDTERQRLTQAATHLASNGTVVQTVGQTRPWLLTGYEWEAPATRHLPLFFEEPNVERMGYTYGLYWNHWGYESGSRAAECLQPFVSGVHFFSRVATIPYFCGVDSPFEPIYTLGVDRPGSPVPYRTHLVPISLKGAIYQAGVVVGIGYIIP